MDVSGSLLVGFTGIGGRVILTPPVLRIHSIRTKVRQLFKHVRSTMQSRTNELSEESKNVSMSINDVSSFTPSTLTILRAFVHLFYPIL